jgi:hypothetical protein
MKRIIDHRTIWILLNTSQKLFGLYLKNFAIPDLDLATKQIYADVQKINAYAGKSL